MKKISIVFIVIVLLLSVLNPFFFLMFKNGYSEKDTIKADIATNLELCKKGDLQIVHDFYKEELTSLLSELQNIDYNIVNRDEAYDIIYKYDIDENATYTSVPTRYDEVSGRVLSNIQIFESDNISYILCEYYYPSNSKSEYSLFTFEATDKLTTLLNSDILYSHGSFSLHITYTKEWALKHTVRYFVPISLIAVVLFVPYIVKEKNADKQTKKTLMTMAKIGFVAIPVFLIIAYVKLYL